MQGRGYNTTVIDLSTAGTQRISQESGYFLFMDAVNAAGVQQLDALVEIAFGAYPGEWLPFRLNNKVEGYFGDVTLRWVAQSGWTAKFYQSRGTKPDYDLMPLRLDTPPAKQLVTSSLSSNVRQSTVNVLTTATKLFDALSTRQAFTLYNVGPDTAYLGNSSVDKTGAQTGLFLPTGRSFRTDRSVAAWYAISTSVSTSINVLEEY